jgi:hypothetical protein
MERVFRQEFDALRHGRIPKWDTVLKRVNNPHVNATSRFVQSIQSVHRPENIERVQQKSAAESIPLSFVAVIYLQNFKHYFSKNFTQRFDLSCLQNSSYSTPKGPE